MCQCTQFFQPFAVDPFQETFCQGGSGNRPYAGMCMSDQRAQRSRVHQGLSEGLPDWKDHLFNETFVEVVVSGDLWVFQDAIKRSPHRFGMPDPGGGFEIP